MTGRLRLASLCVLAVLITPLVAWAQFPSEVVGFNGPPIDEFTAQEMFRIPEYSPTTVDYIILNTPGEWDNNYAARFNGLQTEGDAALQASFKWVDPADPDAWVRFTTANGPERPNPALHLAGQVRFKLTNKSEIFDGELGVCLGIRETAANVPQLEEGGTLGDIEWVGVSTSHNGIVAGPDNIVNTQATGDDVQEYPVGTDIGPDGLDLPSGTAVVSVGPNGDLDTAPTGDDQVRFGYFIAADGNRRPIPAITLPPRAAAYILEWDLSTGDVTVDGTPTTAGIAGFSGDGQLLAAPMRGTLEHVALTNITDDTAVLIDFAIDELQFEAPEADPVRPPTVLAPIIAGDDSVTVTDLQQGVDQVKLYVNGDESASQDVTTADDVVFPIADAVAGDTYTATQRVGGVTSGPSAGILVLPEAASYTFSIVIDDDGTNCDWDYEFVPVTDVGSGPVPQGSFMFNLASTWQTIDIPLTNPNVVMAWLGGNGTLDPSPTDEWAIDSMWFAIAEGADAGPYEVYIDTVQALDETDQVLTTIHDMESGVNYLQYPRGQSTTTPTSSALSTTTAYDGVRSHRLLWTFPSTEPTETLGMFHGLGYACGTSPTFPDTAAKVRFHMLLRRLPDDPSTLPAVAGPIIVGTQNAVRVNNRADATAVQLYINGQAVGDPVTPTGEETDFTDLTLEVGNSVSATQTLPDGRLVSDFAYPRVVSAEPPAPTVVAPIAPGSMSVEVTGVLDVPFATATLVTVYVNGDEHGSAVPTGPTVTVPLDVTLVTGNTVTAKQTVNGVLSEASAPVTVAHPAPVLYMAPAQGADTVQVISISPDAESVTVVVNDLVEHSDTLTPGSDRWDVPVSGLVMGDVIRAYYTVAGIASVQSDYEVVTTDVATAIKCDDFEYSETQYQAAWATAGTYPRLGLVDTMNATPLPATKSLYAPEGNSRVDASIAPLIPTEQQPVIFNVDIYDPVGVGSTAVQFGQLTGDLVSGDWFLLEVGILGWDNTDNVHYDVRAIGNGGPNWVDLDQFDGPDRSVGWHNFTVVHKGNRLDVYVDGLLGYKNLPLSAETTYEWAIIGAAPYSAGTAYYDDYCVEVGPVRFGEVPPPPPVVAAPIEDGDEVVTVTGVVENVTLLNIVDESSIVIGTYTGPMDPEGVEVTLTRSLVHLESITAEMTTPVWGVLSSSPLEVGKGNGDVLVCIGIRETDDTGPLGSPGGNAGEIEWVGAASEVSGAPQGVAISPSSSWQTLTFDPASPPITAFPGSGDGIITSTRGVLEHLAISVDTASMDRSTGMYELYVDNVVNVGAGDGGVDFVIADFEGLDLGTEALFQEPTYSGTTGADMAPLPSASEVSDAEGNPGQSELLVWFWKDTDAGRWARLTTYQALEIPSPIIDLTKPIRLDILLRPPQELCAGDMDCDGDVDFDDINPFIEALAGAAAWPYPNCPWLNGDCDADGDVDFDDINPFVARIGSTCP